MARELTVEKRNTEEKNPRELRREGFIPATVYGPDIDSYSVQLDAKEFSKLPVEDYTHVIDLKHKDGDSFDTLIKHIQRNFVSGEVQNIEFYKLKKGHKVQTVVKLKYANDSEAVKMGADLVAIHDEAHIKCLPRQIPSFIEVDLSALKEDGDHITFGDLKIEEGIELLEPAAEIICKAETKKITHDIEEPTAPAEGEEGAEGEAGAPAAEGAEASTEGGEKAEAKPEEKK